MTEPTSDPKPGKTRPSGPIPMPADEPAGKKEPTGPIPMPADEPTK